MNVRRPAAGHTQPSTLKFGVGSPFHPGSAPSQGATPNVDPGHAPSHAHRPAHCPAHFCSLVP